VKLWGFVLLEVAAVASASGLVVFSAHRLGAGYAEAHGAADRSPPHLLTAAPPPFEPSRVEIATTPAGTFLGMKDELLLDHIRTAEIAEAKLNKGGSSISFRLTFTDGTRAAFKPQQTNPQTVPRKEVAAYRLERLLGLNAVPPATMRTLHRDDLVGKLPPDAQFLATRIDAETIFDDEGFTRGEVSYWIPTILDSHLDTLEMVLNWWQWMTIGEEIPPDRVEAMAQLSSVLIFDMLQNNSDRMSGGNLMTSPDGHTLYYMDNTFGFQADPEGHAKCRTYLMRSQKFSRRMVEAVRALDAPSFRHALENDPGVLTTDEINAVIARKDVTLKYIDGLIEKYGAEKVLVFP
jgi:hypothetical protein